MQKPRQGVPIRFIECSACGRNFEACEEYFDLEDDLECIFCVFGDPVPEAFEKMDYIVLEDSEDYTPRRLQECFSKIDEPTAEQQMVNEAKEPKRKKPKNKHNSGNKHHNHTESDSEKSTTLV